MMPRLRKIFQKLLKGFILPLVILIEWDFTDPGDPNVVIQGFRIERNIQNEGFTLWATINNPAARIASDGSVTAGVTAQYRIKAFGTVTGVASESSFSNVPSLTNTTDAPLQGPGQGPGEQPIFR